MSVFRQALEEICEGLDGVVLATIMGLDGLPIDTVAGPDDGGPPIEVDALLVEYSSLLQQVKKSAQVFAAGGLEELSIRAQNLTTIIRLVTEEYFVALAIRPDASFGKARYRLRRTAPSLISELS